MAVYVGSARIDENKKGRGGAVGDQTQKSIPDYSGEVSQQKFYVHTKGWNILRPKKVNHAMAIAANMITACNNANLGYDQGNRLGVITYGINTKVKTECDCSSLVRACIKEATGKDPGNFTTANEVSMLMKTGMFDQLSYTSGMILYTGDVLVTKTQGHTVIVTSGAARNSSTSKDTYYPSYAGSTVSIVTALRAVGEKDTSYAHRAKIAAANNISGYKGSAAQNTTMLNLLKQGKLKSA
jgi:hypothetical protein